MRKLIKVIPFAPLWLYEDNGIDKHECKNQACIVVAEWADGVRSIFLSDKDTVEESFIEGEDGCMYENLYIVNDRTANGFDGGISLADSNEPETNKAFFKALAEAQTFLVTN
jgi:hypothetical protein